MTPISPTEQNTAVEKLITFYRDDLTQSNLDANPEEFPITPMGEALARAMARVIGRLAVESSPRALDMGTGSGIHSAILSLMGCRDIRAVDIHPDAVSAAADRFDRLTPNLQMLEGSVVHPVYEVADIDDISGGAWDIIVANPPGYFHHVPPRTPLESGLFDGPVEEARNSEKSFLYRFFKNVVGPGLASGGVALCTWQAIQSRLAHDLEGVGEPIVHPSFQLKRWFGWNIESASDDWRQAFHMERPISASGMDAEVLERIKADIRQGGRYSPLLKIVGNDIHFRFGVVMLRRDTRDPNTFRMDIVSRADD